MGAQSGCADFFAAPYACQLEKALPHSDPQSSNTAGCKSITYYQAWDAFIMQVLLDSIYNYNLQIF